jgi:hypothetical protein
VPAEGDNLLWQPHAVEISTPRLAPQGNGGRVSQVSSNPKKVSLRREELTTGEAALLGVVWDSFSVGPMRHLTVLNALD